MITTVRKLIEILTQATHRVASSDSDIEVSIDGNHILLVDDFYEFICDGNRKLTLDLKSENNKELFF